MAYNGETIMVPRKQGHNVVIISETEYNELSSSKRISAYSGYQSGKRTQNQTEMPDTEGNVRCHNMEKLSVIRNLNDYWNGNGAPSFPKALIDKTVSLISGLVIQPEVFPTALGTIQLEFDNSRRDHMEIEIGESDLAEVFVVNFDGAEFFEDIPVSVESINERVKDFYG